MCNAHSQPPAREIPISDDDARIIDEARRTLAARMTGQPMAPEPETINMATREIRVPRGKHDIQIDYISVIFQKDAPRARAMIADYLKGRLTDAIRPRRQDTRRTWRYDVNHIFKMDFDSLLITFASIRMMGPIMNIRAQGIYHAGLFILEMDQAGEPNFKLCGDRFLDAPSEPHVTV